MTIQQTVLIGERRLEGFPACPGSPSGIVVFAHGPGSSRFSRRNAFVAVRLQAAGFAALLFDLLTDAEAADRANVFDIPLLGERVAQAVDWLARDPATAGLPLGLFGASTGAGAALVAAARAPERVAAVVSRGGRPDLAGSALPEVRCPTLLIVGGNDSAAIELNRQAMGRLRCETELAVVPGATHLFEEPGTLDQVVGLAVAWFGKHLRKAPDTPGDR